MLRIMPTRGATKDVEMAPPAITTLSTGLIGAHTALMVHTNEIRSRGNLPAFDQYIAESGFGWLESMLDHAKEQVKQHAASQLERAKYGAKQRNQDALAVRGEMLKTPSRKKVAASRFPGGERVASKAWRTQQREDVAEELADKENAPVPVAAPSRVAQPAAAAAAAPVKAANTSVTTTTRSTRSKADKSEIVKIPNPFAASSEPRGKKNTLPDMASSGKKSSKPSKKAKTTTASSSTGGQLPSSSSGAASSQVASSSSGRDAAQVSALAAPASVLVAVEISSDVDGSMIMDEHDVASEVVEDHPRASTPPKTRAAASAKAAKAKLDESLLPIEEAHSSDTSDVEELGEQLATAVRSPQVPVEPQPQVEAAPVVAAPKRTLGAKESTTGIASTAAPAASTQTTTTSAGLGFASSFLSKSLRGKLPATANDAAEAEPEELLISPSLNTVQSIHATILANAQSSSSSSSSSAAHKKRKSDELDSPEEPPFSDALSDSVDEANKARKLDAAVPRFAPEVARALSGGNAPSSSSSATITTGSSTQRGNLENIMSRLEKVRRTSGAQRGNAGAALLPTTSTVGLGAGLASSILGGRSNAQPAITSAPVAQSANWEQLDDADSSAEEAVAETKEMQRQRVPSSESDADLKAVSRPASPKKVKARQVEASTTPVHSPAPRAEVGAPVNECAVATDSEDDEPPAPIRAVSQPHRDDTAMTLDELARKEPAPLPATAVAAAAAKSKAPASQGLGRMMQPVKPIADMPKISVNLGGGSKPHAPSKSMHRPKPQPQQASEDHVAASALQTTSAEMPASVGVGATSSANANARNGWGIGIIDRVKGVFGTSQQTGERVITPSGSGFMPSRPGASSAATQSQGQSQGRAAAPLGSAVPRKNSITGPSGNIGGALAGSQNGKPASLARAEQARKKEQEEADRKKREKDDRRMQLLAAREAKGKGKNAAAESSKTQAGKRAREEEKAQVPYVSVPSVVKPKVPTSVTARVKELGISPDGKRRRLSDERDAAPSTKPAPPRPQPAASGSRQVAQPSNSGIPRGNNFGASHSSVQAPRFPAQAQSAKPVVPSGNVFQQGAASRPAQAQPLPRTAASAHQTPKSIARAATPEAFVDFVEPASDYSQSGDEETEERRGKEQPWEREELLAALERQRHVDPDAIFGIPHGAVPVQEWLDTLPARTAEQRAQTTERLRRPRTSSGTWSCDGLVQGEIDRYNEAMGIVSSGVKLPTANNEGSASQAAANAKNHRQSFLARGPSALAVDAANQTRNANAQRPGPSGSTR